MCGGGVRSSDRVRAAKLFGLIIGLSSSKQTVTRIERNHNLVETIVNAGTANHAFNLI